MTLDTPDETRRQLIVAAVASGFALAASPTLANAIKTDPGGLTEGWVSVPAGSDTVPAYRAQPDHGTGFPVVLVVQEIFGVHEYIRDICRRLARQGYLAIAPELYKRQGDPSAYADIPELFKEIVQKVPDSQVMADLDATAKWAGSHQGDSRRLAITGFCWGGRIAWLYTAHNPDIKAAVAWYGALVRESNPMQPQHPIDVVGALHAPVLGLYGGADTGISADSIEQMRKALKAAGQASEIVVYPDTPHGFHADYRDSYREGPAKDGWKRLLEWFRQHGV